MVDVKACWRLEAHSAQLTAGKALLSHEIAGDGAVTSSAHEAPTLKGSGVPECIRAAARRWTFPRSRSTHKLKYPIVFVEQG
jgi:hypothetical protein